MLVTLVATQLYICVDLYYCLLSFYHTPVHNQFMRVSVTCLIIT